MANVIRIKRRANGGGAGAPGSLANAELAFNEQTNVLYYGTGTGGVGGSATQVIAIAGEGVFAKLDSPALTGTPTAPTPAENDNSTKIATTAFVQTEIANFGAGTVSSVGLSLPTDIFDVSGSPVTSSGTLTATLDTQSANYVWAGPASGSAATPAFRALVANDIPDISGTYLTTSSASSTYLTQSSAASTYLTQSNAASTYQPLDATLTAVAGVTTGSDKYIYFSGADTAVAGTITSFGRSLVDDIDAAAGRTTLGLGTMATEATTSYYTKTETDNGFQPKDATLTAVAGQDPVANEYIYFTGTNIATTGTITSFGRSLVDDVDAPAARTTLGLGTMATETASNYLTTSAAASGYQPLDADLTALAGVTSAADKLPYFTGSATADVTTLTSFGRSLIDDVDASAARSTLGLGTMATETASNYLTTATAASTYLPLSGGTIDNLTITNNLTVNGTTTTINSTTLTVDDKNIELGSVATPTDSTANGGGITLKGATDKEIAWYSATGAWTSSEDWNLASGKVYKINGTSVLSSTTLGSGVTSSSLTTVGTIGTGTWQGTLIALGYGGTGSDLSGASDGAIFKKSGTGLVAATAGTDYLNNASTVDGGTF